MRSASLKSMLRRAGGRGGRAAGLRSSSGDARLLGRIGRGVGALTGRTLTSGRAPASKWSWAAGRESAPSSAAPRSCCTSCCPPRRVSRKARSRTRASGANPRGPARSARRLPARRSPSSPRTGSSKRASTIMPKRVIVIGRGGAAARSSRRRCPRCGRCPAA